MKRKKEDILKLVKEGLSFVEIGDRCGVSRQQAYNLCAIFGLLEEKRRILADRKSIQKQKREALDNSFFYRSHGYHETEIGTDKAKRIDKIRRMFDRLTYKAKRQNVQIAVKFADLNFPEFCPVFGIPLDYLLTKPMDFWPSFDRVNPSVGYVSGNVCVISIRANRIKNNGTADEHLRIWKYMNNWQNSRSENKIVQLADHVL